MQGFIEFLKALKPHPAIDHFTVALLLVAIFIDLIATLAPSRLWLRYMAATLMIFGAIAAWGSNISGGWEADRVWDHVTGPAKDVLERHAQLGDILPWVFTALALWRLGVGFVGFLARSRAIYLAVAVIAAGVLIYQGNKGGELVYQYGVGTDLMQAEAATPLASPAASIEATPLPTVFVPSPTPSPSMSEAAVPSPTEAMPSVTPSPINSSGTTITPPSAAASPAASSSPSGQPTTL